MNGEIITIGNELISGRILNLNSWYAAGRLTASGLKVTRITSVGDDLEMVSKVLKESMACSQFVIITGGLGSTEDDITNEIVAKVLNRPLCLDKEMFHTIQDYTSQRGLEMSPALEKMAWMPKGSKMLDPRGTACGFLLLEGGVSLYFLPGVPDQMRYLMDKFVLPQLLLHCKVMPVFRQRILKLYGISEPEIAQILKDLPGRSEDIIMGFYPYFPENHITLCLRGHDETHVLRKLKRVEKEIRRIMGPWVFASGNKRMEDVIGEMLRKRKWTISVAESCTGGLIGNLLTNTLGSSTYFQGGVIAYSNRVKMDILGVSPDSIEKFGAVSDQTVREMASGVKDVMHTDMGIAVSGIAGPEGGSKEKPVGTVHVGMAACREIFSGKYRFWGTREQVKLNSAMMALDWVRRYLNGNPFFPGL